MVVIIGQTSAMDMQNTVIGLMEMYTQPYSCRIMLKGLSYIDNIRWRYLYDTYKHTTAGLTDYCCRVAHDSFAFSADPLARECSHLQK